MSGDSGFLVEDFIHAITTQLDRVQDTLRLKALNRPLTYALKDFALDLNVFVDMDREGHIRFRSSGPNETGASTVRLGFTTITKPMIEENTVSLTMTRGPTLSEMDLAPEEQRQLERLGVRNVNQLQRLQSSTGTTTVSRLSGIPANRLRRAMQQGRPYVRKVEPVREPPPPRRRSEPTRPVEPLPVQRPGRERAPGVTRPKLRDIREAAPPVRQVYRQPAARRQVRSEPDLPPQRAALQPRLEPIRAAQPVLSPAERESRLLRPVPDTRRLRLLGANLIGAQGAPIVRLNDETLRIAEADEDEIIVEMPTTAQSGPLEIELPDGQVLSYDLRLAADDVYEQDFDDDSYADPWSPREGGM